MIKACVIVALVGCTFSQIVLRDQPDVKFTLGLANLNNNQDQVVRVQRPQIQSIRVEQPQVQTIRVRQPQVQVIRQDPQIQVIRSQPQYQVVGGEDSLYRIGGGGGSLSFSQPQIRVQPRRQQVIQVAQPQQIRVQTAPQTIRVNQGGSNLQYAPTPFEYSYIVDEGQGSHAHSSRGDGSGRVEGEYSINLGAGQTRVVKYTADENGFVADVTTDELGTESKDPADVRFVSSAITGAQAALTYGPFAPEQRQTVQTVQQRQDIRQIQNRVNLPTYGTFSGSRNAV
jgi:hypothetical protein